MTYLMTYKNGMRAVATTVNKGGLSFQSGSKKIIASLVDTNASNATNVRVKLNNTIKALAYVPSLVIPWTLTAKYGAQLTRPVGINYKKKFYDTVIYNKHDGRFYALSSKLINKFNPGDALVGYTYLANSLDGVNWQETSLNQINYSYNSRTYTAYSRGKAGFIYTSQGCYLVSLYFRIQDSTRDYDTVDFVINIYKLEEGNITLIKSIVDRQYPINRAIPVINFYNASSPDKSVGLFTVAYCEDYSESGFYVEKLYAITDNNCSSIQNKFAKDLSFNKLLNTFMFNNKGSYDGTNFSDSIPHALSYGNLNGEEVIEVNGAAGLSSNGATITKTFSKMPLAFDPIDKKYIAARARIVPTGQGSQYDPYVDTYTSTDLNNWTLLETVGEIDIGYNRDLTGTSGNFASVIGY